MLALPNKRSTIALCLFLAATNSARSQQTDQAHSSLTIKDTVPAGFENLMQEQTLFIEVTFNDRHVGTFEVVADAENLTFTYPRKLVDSLDNIHKQPQLIEALSAPLPTNAHQICYARNEPIDCGQVDASPVAVIFDESLLTLDLFVDGDFQLIQNEALQRYLPAAEKRGSSIFAVDMLASDNPRQSSLDFTTRVRTSYGAGHVYAEAEYNTRTDMTRVRSVQLTHLFRDRELTMGTFSHRTESLLNNTQILGASFRSSFSTRVDLEGTFSSQLVVYLSRRSLVQIVIDERVYLARRYDAGNQTLDTGPLPGGTYEVEIRINDPIAGVRSEFQLFTKSAQIPPRDETLFDVTLGVPVQFTGDTLPVQRDLSLGSASMSRRLNDQSSWRLGVLGVGPLAMAEANYLLLGKHVSLQLGIGAGNRDIRSGTFRLSYTGRRTSAGVNARVFSAAPSVYTQESLEGVMPRHSTQIGATVNHSFDKTTFSARISDRSTTDMDGNSRSSLQQTLTLGRQLFQRGGLRANAQVDYRQSEDGYEVNVRINGSFLRSRSTTSFSTQASVDEADERTSRQVLTHRLRSDVEASTSWSTEIQAGSDDSGQSLGVSSTIENELVSASISNEWTRRQENSFERSTVAKLGTRIAMDAQGLAIGGTRMARSGMIVDVSGEPTGAEYDIVINGIKKGSGKIDEKRFIGLDPLQQYVVQLLPTATLTSSLDTTSFEFTVYPGAVHRLQSSAKLTVLLVATIVDESGELVDDGTIRVEGNPLRISPEGVLQIEAGPGEILEIQRQGANDCSITVPAATDNGDVSIPELPLICI